MHMPADWTLLGAVALLAVGIPLGEKTRITEIPWDKSTLESEMLLPLATISHSPSN
jgi:hypothetical protein